MKNIKAIIFDAYGTLFDVNSAAEKCKDKIGDKWEGFANYWRTTQLEYTWLRSLMKRHKDFWQVTEDSLDKSMKAYKIDSSIPLGPRHTVACVRGIIVFFLYCLSSYTWQ